MNDKEHQSRNLLAIYDVSIQLLQVRFPNVFLVLKTKFKSWFKSQRKLKEGSKGQSYEEGVTNLVSKAV